MQFDDKEPVRAVHRSEIVRATDVSRLETYMADRVPYFYKSTSEIAAAFEEGYFLSAIKAVLRKLPVAESFQESHFGEILAGIYGEEILGLHRLYSKLALLTAENANAFKMDVLFYRPGTDPVHFVLAEVKSSMKTVADGVPAKHDAACFPSLFASLNKYKEADQDFDLDRIKERMVDLPATDHEAIIRSLLPHRPRLVQFAGFCVIDSSTHNDDEASLLATRKNKKTFDVDLLCVAELPTVVDATYKLLAPS
jgi:hypothetical protein